MRQLHLQQPCERAGLIEPAVRLAQQRLYVAVVGPVGQRVAVGLGGFAMAPAAAQRVAQPCVPVRALGLVLAQRRGAPTQRRQLVLAPRALIEIRERLRDRRDRSRLVDGALEGCNGARQIVERPGPKPGDAQAQ